MKGSGRIGLPFCSDAEQSLKFKREGMCHYWPKRERNTLQHLVFGIDENTVCGPFLFILVSCIEEDEFVCFTFS